MNLVTLLVQQARDRPDAPALHDRVGGRARTTSFRGLAAAAASVADGLAARGVTSGHRVLVLAPMSLELYASVLGALSQGAVVVVPDLSMERRAVAQALQRFPCQAFVGSPRAHLMRLLVRPVRRIRLKFVMGGWAPAAERLQPGAGRATLRPAEVTPEHAAVLTFTSGSTGRPKAALRTHGFLLAQERAIGDVVGTGPGDTDLAFLPLFVLANLARGVASVLPDADLRRPASIDANRVLAQAAEHGVTSVGGPPAALLRLAERARDTHAPLGSLRRIHCGGGPVLPHHFDVLQALGPEAEVVAVYGSTEAEPIAELPLHALGADDREATREGSGVLVGRPVPSILVAVLEDAWGRPVGPFTEESFARSLVPAGAAGEIVVTGPHVLSGYADARDDAETKFRVDGVVWHRTGDGGRLDARGRLWLLGRCAARLRDERGSLWPLAVEAAVRDDPRVLNAALVSVAGRRVLAVTGTGLEPDEIKERVQWADVDDVRIIKRLPVDRRHESKIDYKRLRQLLRRS